VEASEPAREVALDGQVIPVKQLEAIVLIVKF